MLKFLGALSGLAVLFAAAVATSAEAAIPFAPCPATWAEARRLSQGHSVTKDLSEPGRSWKIYDGAGRRVLGFPLESLIFIEQGKTASMSFWFAAGTQVEVPMWAANGRACPELGRCAGDLYTLFPGIRFGSGDLREIVPIQAQTWSEIRCNYEL